MTLYTIPEVRSLLRVWAAWCVYLDTPIGPAPATCLSAESNYRSPQVWHAEQPRRPEPDRRIGERLEAIVRTMDERHAMALRLWYVRLPRTTLANGVDPVTWCARQAHLGSHALFVEVLQRGERDIAEALR